MMMIIAPNSRAHKGKKERGEVKEEYGGVCGEEEGNADYGGIVGEFYIMCKIGWVEIWQESCGEKLIVPT